MNNLASLMNVPFRERSVSHSVRKARKEDTRPVSFVYVTIAATENLFLHFYFPNFIPKKGDVCGRLRCPQKVTLIITIKYLNSNDKDPIQYVMS